MRLPVRLLAEAKDEFELAALRYEQKQAGLGVDFISRVRDVFQRIATNPHIHGTVYKDVRKAVVQRFPYIVLYQEDQGEVVVVAVFHTSRNPIGWQTRI